MQSGKCFFRYLADFQLMENRNSNRIRTRDHAAMAENTTAEALCLQIEHQLTVHFEYSSKRVQTNSTESENFHTFTKK